MDVPSGQSRLSRWQRDTGHPLPGDVPCPDIQTTAALLGLADRVRRLVPSTTDPEHFHVEKSEIEHALRRLAEMARNIGARHG